MTASVNVVEAGGDGFVHPVATDGTFDINAGDLVYFDTAAHILKGSRLGRALGRGWPGPLT